MKALGKSFFLLMLIPAVVFAGQIFGSIKKEGRPLAGTMVRIIKDTTTRSDKSDFGTTDSSGLYTLSIRGTGSCFLVVYHRMVKLVSDRSNTPESDTTQETMYLKEGIYIDKKPVRYDWDIVVSAKTKDSTKYLLKRR